MSEAGESAARRAARVLIAEDEKHLALLLEHFLAGRGHQVDVVHDGHDAVARLTAAPYDVALLDVQMPGLDGLAVLRAVRGLPLPPQVIVMTGNGTIDTALAAIETGAYDYVSKPYRMAEVELLVRRAAERRRLEGVAAAADRDDVPITQWAPLRAVLSLIERTAPALGGMLVHGEPGTGRTLLARHAHRLAGGGPFAEADAACDAATLARRLAAARGGTLYLRGVERWATAAQRAVGDAYAAGLAADDGAAPRLVAAARPGAVALHPSLGDALAAAVVELPPLRDRVGDVAALVEAFVRRAAGASPPVITEAALARLERHPWPGNVAELRLVIEGAVARAEGVIEPHHLGLPELALPTPGAPTLASQPTPAP